jgi:protein required for attachment to host cells
MHNIPTGTWVIVAGIKQARLFHNAGTQDALRLKQDELIELDTVDADGQGPSGGRPRDESPEQIEEATFAKQLAHRLNAAAVNRAFEHLFIVANPKTLGTMRPLLHPETVKRITGELNKTLDQANVEDIEKVIRAHD